MGEPEGESVAGGPEMRDEVVVQFRHPSPTTTFRQGGAEAPAEPMEGKCSSEGKGFPNGSVSVLLPQGNISPKYYSSERNYVLGVGTKEYHKVTPHNPHTGDSLGGWLPLLGQEA